MHDPSRGQTTSLTTASSRHGPKPLPQTEPGAGGEEPTATRASGCVPPRLGRQHLPGTNEVSESSNLEGTKLLLVLGWATVKGALYFQALARKSLIALDWHRGQSCSKGEAGVQNSPPPPISTSHLRLRLPKRSTPSCDLRLVRCQSVDLTVNSTLCPDR